MMARTVLLIALLGFTASALAQTGVIRGTVRDADGVALPGVNVFLAGTTLGAATGPDGQYRIPNLQPGAYTVVASVVGFRREERAASVAAGGELTIDFTLHEIVLESGEVVVTAGRRAQLSSTVPASISVVSPRELEARNVVSLDDALDYVPGVQLMGNQVNIRGSSGFAYNTGSRVLLLLDGVPLLTPDSDGVPFDALPVAQIAQVEVLKGPGSALYGSGALGGVVQVVTKPFPERPETSAQLYGGFHDPVRYQVWRDLWSAADTPRAFGGGSLSHARRFRGEGGMWVNLSYRNDPGYMNFSAQNHFHGYAKVGTALGEAVRLTVLTGIMVRTRDNFLFWNGARDALNPGSLSLNNNPSSPTGTNDIHSNQFSLLPTVTHVVGPQLFYSVKARLFGTVFQPIDNDTGKVKPISEGTLGFRYGGEVQANWAPGRDRYLTAGITGDANATRSSFFVTSDGDDAGGQPEFAVFGQWEQPLGPINVVAGLRFDTYAIDAAETVRKLSPKLSAAYPLGEHTTVRAAYGQGFRVPSFAERFTDNQDFLPIFRNLELRPEQSTSFEVGLLRLIPLGADGGLHVDVAVFWNEFEDLIEPKFVRLSNPSRVGFQFVNLTEARIRGLDASVEGAWRDDRVTLNLSYTYLNADDLSQQETLSYRPPHLFKVALDARPYGPLTAGLDFRYATAPERVDSDFARFVPDADFLVDTRVLDLRLGVRMSRLSLALIVKNALDYYYLLRPALLAPPREFILRLQVDL